MTLSWVAALVVSAALSGGCGNRNSVNDVQIRNAPGLTGYERRAVCNVCQAHSECGTSTDASLWATEHYQKTGHKSFTREACHTPLGSDWTMGTKGAGQQPQRPSLQEQRAAADTRLPVGITLNEARLSMGDVGVLDQEKGDTRTFRFRQTISDGATTLARDVWADFDTIGTLTAARYAPWTNISSGR
jgi:hypothetical protein